MPQFEGGVQTYSATGVPFFLPGAGAEAEAVRAHGAVAAETVVASALGVPSTPQPKFVPPPAHIAAMLPTPPLMPPPGNLWQPQMPDVPASVPGLVPTPPSIPPPSMPPSGATAWVSYDHVLPAVPANKSAAAHGALSFLHPRAKQAAAATTTAKAGSTTAVIDVETDWTEWVQPVTPPGPEGQPALKRPRVRGGANKDWFNQKFGVKGWGWGKGHAPLSQEPGTYGKGGKAKDKGGKSWSWEGQPWGSSSSSSSDRGGSWYGDDRWSWGQHW